MKTALVTTTINVPRVLKLYRKCSPGGVRQEKTVAPWEKVENVPWKTRSFEGAAFFVTGDMKTDSIPFKQFCREIPNCFAYDVVDQNTSMDWACHDLIGWNTISRRSIAILEALKWGAEIIVTVDDDNIPMSTDYFDRFERVLAAPFSGCQVDPAVWFNVGALCEPFFVQRGFPQGHLPNCYDVKPVVGAKVGVASGVAFGDPDISAVERMAKGTHAHTATELLRAGVVFKPAWKQWTVFNSQVTAFTRELAPCFLMVPQWKRFDDIFASLICQRVMRELNQVVHFGRPFVYQARNEHDLQKDLEAEMWGMRWVQPFASWLDDLPLPKTQQAKYGNVPATALTQVRTIYDQIAELDWMPKDVAALGQAWCDDCEKVLV